SIMAQQQRRTQPIQSPIMAELRQPGPRQSQPNPKAAAAANKAILAISELAEYGDIVRLQLIARTAYAMLREFDAR
ncbi:MAG TPA: hypothetical protein VE287_05010, partial [Actinopolymorphaceae bacterium]|nr:hypothetical protein [Actinopolymorphaceae bacterium]